MAWLKISLRLLAKEKGYALINVMGMAAGLACAIIVLLWIKDESEYEGIGEKTTYVTRIVELEYKNVKKFVLLKDVDEIVIKEIRIEIPETETIIKFGKIPYKSIYTNYKYFIEDKILIGGKDFYEFLNPDFNFISQEPNLLAPGSVILSLKTCIKYFEDTKIAESFLPLNRKVNINNNIYRVSAVTSNQTDTPEFQYDLLLSDENISDFAWNKLETYYIIKVNEKSNSDLILSQIKNIISKKGLNIREHVIKSGSLEKAGKMRTDNFYNDNSPFIRTSDSLTEIAKRNCKEIINTLRVEFPGTIFVDGNGVTAAENKFLFADKSVFDMFSFYFLKGNSDSALLKPNSVILTNQTARRYFGTEDPIGKLLKINEKQIFTVTGVVKNLPYNYLINFDFLADFKSVNECRKDNSKPEILSYIKLNKAHSIDYFNSKYMDLLVRLDSTSKNIFGASPLPTEYLYENFDSSKRSSFDDSYTVFFSILSTLLLFLSTLNYINLSIARSSGRAKEVGLKKLFGSSRSSLMIQFTFEAILIAILSLIISYIFVYFSLPTINIISGKNLVFSLSFDDINIKIVLIALLTGLISGSYPAFYLSKLEPAGVLSGELRSGAGRFMLRKVIIFIQFTLSISFVIWALAFFGLMNNLRDLKVGYDKEYTVKIPINTSASGGTPDGRDTSFPSSLPSRVPLDGETTSNLPLIRKALSRNKNIISINDAARYNEKFTGISKMDTLNYCYVSIKHIHIPETIEFLRRHAQLFNSDGKFKYEFSETEFEKMYQSEEQIFGLFYIFTIIAVIISLFGLFGIASFMIGQRRHELAVRKICGAGLYHLTMLTTKELVYTVLVSNFAAWALAYPPLEDYLYRFLIHSPIGLSSFLYSGAAALVLAGLTAGFIALKTGMNDPIKAIVKR
ncbi:MAG: transporter permease [Ignavibacteria bacterium]|nr:transporter permease [Ignavibacteria bacterium]